jgi:hypothetical protein
MTIQSIKLTDAELGAVLTNGKVKIKRPVAMATPLQQSIVNDLTTDWRFDGLWRIKDGGDNCYYLEKISDAGNPLEKYESIGPCPFGNAGARLHVENGNQSATLKISSVQVERIKNSTWTLDWGSCGKVERSENPFLWIISAKKIE